MRRARGNTRVNVCSEIKKDEELFLVLSIVQI